LPAGRASSSSTAGLDVESRHAVWAAIRQHAGEGGTTLLTTHHLEEAEALATRVAVIESGGIVTDGTLAAIKAEAGLTRVTFRCAHACVVEEAEREGELLSVLTRDAGALVERLVLDGVSLVDLDVRPITLEEALSARAGKS
jgi:ABC-2 type transport system ATP-binding protein